MAPSLGGNSASPPDPETSRIVISHRDVGETYFSDADDDVVENPAEEVIPNGATTNGDQVVLATFQTALMEATVGESSSDEDDNGADLAAAPTAAVAYVPEELMEHVMETLGDDVVDLDVKVNADLNVVPETQESATIAGTAPKTGRGRVGTKSASATPAAKNSATPKSKSKPAASRTEAKADADQVEFAGQVGPDTSLDVDGETQWEIERIAGSENDGKTLLVKWKGWKGFWEEDRDNIADSAPALVEAFEKRQKEGKGGRAGKKAATAAAGGAAGAKGQGSGKGRPGPAPKKVLGPKTKGVRVAKKAAPAAAAAPKRGPGAKRGPKPKSAGAATSTATSPAKKTSTSTPKKKAAAAVADAVPKNPAKSPATTRQGPPKTRGPVPAKASAPRGKARTGAGVKKNVAVGKKNIKTAPTKKAVEVVQKEKVGGRKGRPRKA